MRAAPIHYENRGTPTHLPLLRAIVVKESHVDEATDHEGRRVPVYRTDNVQVSIEGWGSLFQSAFLVSALPAPFEKNLVGGIISPQLLPGAGESLIVDLKAGRMRLDTAVAADADFATHTGCVLTPSAVPPCSDRPVGGQDAPLFALSGRVDSQDVRMIVDTGSVTTDVMAASSAGTSLHPWDARATAFVLSGPSPSRVVADAVIRVGDCAFVRNLDVIGGIGGPTCARDGALGIDVLHSCVLLVDRARLLGRCAD